MAVDDGEHLRKVEKVREDYPYTDIRIRTSKTSPNRFEFYVRKGYEATFQKLELILKREGRSLSEWIRENAVDYVRLHEAGNPQQLLPPLLNGERPYHALVCQKHGKPVPSLVEFLAASGLTLRYCENCFQEAKQKRLVKRVIKKLF